MVLRHPVDLRASWVRYIETCFNQPCKEANFPNFADIVTPDDFVDVPVTLCNTTGKAQSYEAFVSEWIREAKGNPENVLIVFYESALSNPSMEVKRIAKFLSQPLEEEVYEKIVKDVTVEGAQPSSPLRKHSCGNGGSTFKKSTIETLTAAWARVVTDVEVSRLFRAF